MQGHLEGWQQAPGSERLAEAGEESASRLNWMLHVPKSRLNSFVVHKALSHVSSAPSSSEPLPPVQYIRLH